MAEPDCAPDCDERDECTEVGKIGHTFCGHCDTHNRPRHHCGVACQQGDELADRIVQVNPGFTLFDPKGEFHPDQLTPMVDADPETDLDTLYVTAENFNKVWPPDPRFKSVIFAPNFLGTIKEPIKMGESTTWQGTMNLGPAIVPGPMYEWVDDPLVRTRVVDGVIEEDDMTQCKGCGVMFLFRSEGTNYCDDCEDPDDPA